jgi:dCMP deaminase
MEMAIMASKRSTCDRLYVGAVIVKNKSVLSTGYNGSVVGMPHCSGPAKYTECSYCGKIMEWTEDNEDTMQYMFSCPECDKLGTLQVKTSVGHMMDELNHCTRTVHAEQNALVQAAKNGVAVNGASIYVTHTPCWTCFKMIVNAGIKKIYYNKLYRDKTVFLVAEEAGIEMIEIKLGGID